MTEPGPAIISELFLARGFIKRSEDRYSGKFVVRVPKSLHRSLAAAAEREGVSLNQYALYKLSK